MALDLCLKVAPGFQSLDKGMFIIVHAFLQQARCAGRGVLERDAVGNGCEQSVCFTTDIVDSHTIRLGRGLAWITGPKQQAEKSQECAAPSTGKVLINTVQSEFLKGGTGIN